MPGIRAGYERGGPNGSILCKKSGSVLPVSTRADFNRGTRIVEELDTTFLVEAGAGSGKTTSLVGRNISGSISTTTKDYLLHVQDMNGIGMTKHLTLPALVAISSVALNKPVLSSSVVLGDLSIGVTIMKVEELANTLQVCLDNGAKKVLIPITSAVDLGTVPSELIGCFNIIFYQSAEDAVFKALGVE